MSFTCSSLFHLSVLCLITFYVLLHISFLRLCTYHVFFHVVATCPCYTFHSSFSYLYYHILSYYMLLSFTFHLLSSCTIHILHIHLYGLILSYTLCFRLLSVLYLFTSFPCTILCTFYILYSCTVHVLFSYTYIHVLFISYTGFLLYFSYDSHILCICVFTLTIELAFTTDSRGNLVMFVIL